MKERRNVRQLAALALAGVLGLLVIGSFGGVASAESGADASTTAAGTSPASIARSTAGSSTASSTASSSASSTAPSTAGTTPPQPSGALTLAVAADTDLAAHAETINYTVTVANAGPADATNVPLTDTLSDGVALTFADSGGVHTDGSVTWMLAMVPAHGQVSVHLAVKVTVPNVGRLLINRVGLTNPAGWPAAVVHHSCADNPAQACLATEVPTIEVLSATPIAAVTSEVSAAGSGASPSSAGAIAPRATTHPADPAISVRASAAELAATGAPVGALLAAGLLALLLGSALVRSAHRRPGAH